MANMDAIKALRNKTGAGFADCKKALEQANDNIDAALKILKEMGIAAAEKRSGRATGEGSIFAEARDNKAVLLELMCETDFVARNEEFQTLGKELIDDIFTRNLTQKDAQLESKIQELIGKIKENMEIKRIKVLEKTEHELFATYTHGLPARLGAIVNVHSTIINNEIEKFVFDCALHAVAKLPLFLTPDTISEAYKKEQLDIIHKEVSQLGKPENVAENIAAGKWKKHSEEISFTTQPWVHDEKSTPHAEIKKLEQSYKAQIDLRDFEVFVLGSD